MGTEYRIEWKWSEQEQRSGYLASDTSLDHNEHVGWAVGGLPSLQGLVRALIGRGAERILIARSVFDTHDDVLRDLARAFDNAGNEEGAALAIIIETEETDDGR